MPVAATCPSCGAPLSETSVLALAPVCSHCGVVITSIGGSLGLTSAYGIGDASITRRRVEADLDVFREYQTKYRGMKEACKQQLDWSVERYAQLPRPPEFLKLEDVPLFWKGFMAGGVGPFFWYFSFLPLMSTILFIFNWEQVVRDSEKLWTLVAGDAIPLGFMFHSATRHLRAKNRNGNKPLENARRKMAHEAAVAAALSAAVPLKEAQDHRLRCQIRDLEGLAKTVDEKKAEISRILATLQ